MSEKTDILLTEKKIAKLLLKLQKKYNAIPVLEVKIISEYESAILGKVKLI